MHNMQNKNNLHKSKKSQQNKTKVLLLHFEGFLVNVTLLHIWVYKVYLAFQGVQDIQLQIGHNYNHCTRINNITSMALRQGTEYQQNT